MLLVIAVVVAIAGAFYAIWYFNKKKNEAAASWPETPGKITVSYVYKEHNKDDDGVKSVRYEPYIHFDYTVDGKTYQGSRVAYRNLNFAIEMTAKKICDAYPVGRDVTVYYDPAHPNDSILERKT